MANEPYITKTDLEKTTQKVSIINAKELANSLNADQKKAELKNLETSIEQKALFQDIAEGIRGLGDSLLAGLKSLIPKTDGGLSKLLGLGLGLLLAPFVVFIAFITQLGVELKFFGKLIGGGLRLLFGPILSWFKKTKLGKKIISVFKSIFSRFRKIFKPITNFFTKNKSIQKVVTLFKRVFTGKGGFFGKIGNFFKAIKTFATGGSFGTIMKFAKGLGRIMGKVFLPINILMSIFDFVKGFMQGYKEDGIIGGIKEGFNSLFEGLIGGLLRILMWIPTKIAEWLGFDKLAAAIGEQTEEIIQSVKDIFGGLVDLVVGLFTWDTEKMSGALSDIWSGIIAAVQSPFKILGAIIEDVFGGNAFDRIKLTAQSISLAVASFFLSIHQAVVGMIRKIPLAEQLPWVGSYLKETAGELNSAQETIKAAKTTLDTLKSALDGADAAKAKAAGKEQTSINSVGGPVTNINNNILNVNAPKRLSAEAMAFWNT